MHIFDVFKTFLLENRSLHLLETFTTKRLILHCSITVDHILQHLVHMPFQKVKSTINNCFDTFGINGVLRNLLITKKIFEFAAFFIKFNAKLIAIKIISVG